MKVGFTGTRHGMTDAQRTTFGVFIALDIVMTEFHHGDCIGADDEAANLARFVRKEHVKIVRHPPSDQTHQAHNLDFDEDREPKTHFARNRDIVDETDILIATPFDLTEQPRGGTWYTVGYARKKGKPVHIVWPDGRIESTREDHP